MTGKSIRILTLMLAFLGALFVLQPAALADEVQMTLTGMYNWNNVMGGVYDSPYEATITDGTQSTQALVICDDFATDISVGDTWSAYQNSLSSVGTDSTTGGPQKFTIGYSSQPYNTTPDTITVGSSTITLNIEQEYTAAALLAEELVNNLNVPTASNSILVGEYSYAIWTIFEPGAINGYEGQLTNSTYQGVINGLRTTALTEAYDGATPYDTVSIYTPNPTSASQEFLVVNTPEASSLANLAVDLLLLAGAVFVVRRRRLTSGLSN